uniref:glycosyltransferase family 2 protein n=1 Tax=Anaerostipes hadrus TaxID=649756 RepID=UPI0040282AFB
MDKISVIIPVYNVEKYLDKCIESVVRQTYQNIEIILVNDGSLDNSGQICDKWAKNDKRIRVIHKENGGLSDARNFGIDIAQGKFITFVDSDDYISLEYIEYLHQILIGNCADIACCDTKIFFENNTECNERNIREDNVKKFTKQEAFTQMLYEKELTNSAWGKLYKKSLFNNIRFPKGKIYEDMFTTYKLIFRSRCIVKSERKLYHYLIREDSILGTVNVKKQLDMVEAAEEMLDFAIKNASSSIKAATYRVSISSIMVIAHCQVINRNKYEEQIKTNLWNNIKGNRIKIIFDPNAKNKYKILAMISLCGKKALQLFYQKFAKR